MKRLLLKSLTIALCVGLMLSVVACGGGKNPPAVSPTPSVTPSVSATPTPSVSVAPSVTPSVTPSVAPSVVPSVAPSVVPSVAPSVAPTATPSVTPSVTPSLTPSVAPSVTPSVSPSVPAGPTDEELLASVTLNARNVRYNGKRQALSVGNLPQGAIVVYEEDVSNSSPENVDQYTQEGAKKPGVYGVKATVTLNGSSRELYAVLTIKKANLHIKANNQYKDLYAPHPEFTYTVSGLKGEDEFVITEPTPEPAPAEGEELFPESEEVLPEVNDNAVFTGSFVLDCTVGQYAETGGEIIALQLPTSDCYEINFVSANLFINPLKTGLLRGTSGGLKMNGHNEMIYNGKVVSWQGVNYFELFQECFNLNEGTVKESGVQNSFLGLEELAAHNVKAIRFNASFFYDFWWRACYLDYNATTGTYYVGEKAEICIKTMYRLFDKAASLNIGLIPSVFWSKGFAGLYGENNKAIYADHNSQSHLFAMAYQTKLLEALNDHPALFMWEAGNEENLGIDVGQGTTSDDLIRYRKAWTGLISSYNVGYNRVIGSGDSGLRPSQYRQRYGIWGEDNHEQHQEILRELNPGITAVSSHDYPSTRLPLLIAIKQKEKMAELGKDNLTSEENEEVAQYWRKEYYENREAVEEVFAEYGITYEYQGASSANMADVDTITERFTQIVQTAKAIGATCYVGECGPGQTYGETVLQHSKYRNSVLSNGLVINGDELNAGLEETYAEANGVYPDISYEDWLQSYMAICAAQKASGLPLVLYWNYQQNVNINRLNDHVLHSDLNGWGERTTGTEYSMSLSHFGKAKIAMSELKKLNDAWDAENPGAYLS
ncbi:MAG: hypothetical protein IKC56_02380 [Clostridia bacterium]|nr:hypothetical protein [Clostridia bacterium]